ncbi:hypothetical protein JCM10449v2_004931 [Rhodotorula kratochvilovae]
MDPSPSSSAPPPPRASLALLPLELVKQIVAEVNEQDNERLSFTRAAHAEPSAYGPRRAPPHEQDLRPAPVDTGVRAVWSYWYGRGISALSYVNKQLRAFALPHLVEEMSIKQTTKPFALDELHRSPLARLIRKLDFRDDADEPSLLSAAAVIRALDHADELNLGFEYGLLLQPKVATAGAAAAQSILVRQAFASLAPRLKALEIETLDWDDAVNLVKLLSSPSALRILQVDNYKSPFEDDHGDARALLAGLSIQELVISHSKDYWDEADADVVPQKVDASWAGFKMPTVTRFTFSCNCPLPNGFLKLVAHAFPNLEHLSLSIMDATDQQIEPTRGLSPQHLPRLRIVTLERSLAMSPSFVHRLFQSLPSSPVSTLSLRDSSAFTGTSAASILAHIFPSDSPFPTTLRHINLPFHEPPTSSDPDNPMAWAQDRNVRLSFNETPTYWRANRPGRPPGGVLRGTEMLDALHDLARSTFEWGFEHAAALRRVGDEAGLFELEAICGSLRERRYIEKI